MLSEEQSGLLVILYFVSFGAGCLLGALVW
jgi:hypothetical protein